MNGKIEDFFDYVKRHYYIKEVGIEFAIKTDIQDFTTRYPLKNLQSLPIIKYDALKVKTSFCNLLENYTKSIGESSLGSNPNKYFYHEQSTEKYKVNKVQNTRKYREHSTNINEQFSLYINDMKRFIENFNVDSYDAGAFLPGAGVIKSKIIALYRPNEILTIHVAKYFKTMLKAFGKKAVSHDSIALNIMLMNTIKEYDSDFFNKYPSKATVSSCLWEFFFTPKDYLLQDVEDENKDYNEIYVETDNPSLDVEVAPDPISQKNNKSVYPRYIKHRAEAFRRSGFVCAVNHKHNSFTAKSTNNRYLEAHHLIPRSEQGDFKLNIDHHANIVCLCSECHNQLHYGLFSEKKTIIKKLFNKREEELKKVIIKKDGEEFTLEMLYVYYQ